MMESWKKSMAVILFIGVCLAGCSTTEKLDPAHDEVLIYPLAYDLTYLRTMEALEKLRDWDLEETDKEKGWIRIRNIAYSRFDDADKRLATVLVSRVSRRRTSVQLAPESQRIVGGRDLMKQISQYLSREIRA